jgi:hypothetical protein
MPVKTNFDGPVRVFEAGDPKAIDVYLREQGAQRALEDCLRDEPQWRVRLEVTEVELDHEHTSLN